MTRQVQARAKATYEEEAEGFFVREPAAAMLGKN